MVSDRPNQLIGELLNEAGLLEINDLREAANIARSQHLPMGKVLVMSGFISKELLQATIEAQSRIKDNFLKYETALEALKRVEKNNISLDAALSELGAPPRPPDSTSHRLGALLLDAHLITKNEFNSALDTSQRSGLPLGRVLSNLAVLSDGLVNFALNMQKLLRNGRITKEEAVKSLVEVNTKQNGQTDLNASFNAGQAAESPRVSGSWEMPPPAASSGVSPEENPAYAASGGEFTHKELKGAPVQEPIKTNDLTSSQTNAAFPKLDSLSLHHMLRIAGLIQTDALEIAIKESLESPEIMAVILKRSGLLEDFIIEGAKECCQLIGEGVLKPEQAIIALHQCYRTRTPIREYLEEAGWVQKSKITS